MENFFVRLIKLPFKKKALLAFLAGAFASFAFPGFYLVGVLWISFPTVLLLQDSVRSKKHSFFIGFCFGAGMFLFSMFWLYHPLTLMDGQFLWLIPFALLGIACWGGFFIGLVFYVLAFFEGTFFKILVFAFAWTIVEYFRSNFIFGGIAWNTMATVWAKNIEVAQIAAFIGSYNLTFVTVFIASLPFGMKRNYLLASIVLILALYVGGQARMSANPTEFHDITLKIVQPNISQEEKHSRENREEILSLLKKMSSEGENTDYIIWPETSFPYIWRYDSSYNPFGGLVTGESKLITGVMRVEGPKDDFKVFNSVAFIGEDGVEFFYDKQYLVPFGEYVPLGKYLPIEKIVPGQKDISSGFGQDYAAIPGIGPTGVSVCYEVIFSGELKKGPDHKDIGLMINLTNDKWFGRTQAPYQHLANSVLRAIEEGVPVIRAANSGVSAIIDASGRISTATKIEEQTVLLGKFPKELKRKTPFYIYGNRLFFLVQVLILGIIIFLLRQKRKYLTTYNRMK